VNFACDRTEMLGDYLPGLLLGLVAEQAGPILDDDASRFQRDFSPHRWGRQHYGGQRQQRDFEQHQAHLSGSVSLPPDGSDGGFIFSNASGATL
jgi:hypothetical protein